LLLNSSISSSCYSILPWAAELGSWESTAILNFLEVGDSMYCFVLISVLTEIRSHCWAQIS
jgi:hypothetical protein